jgi:hypothetical protein
MAHKSQAANRSEPPARSNEVEAARLLPVQERTRIKLGRAISLDPNRW